VTVKTAFLRESFQSNFEKINQVTSLNNIVENLQQRVRYVFDLLVQFTISKMFDIWPVVLKQVLHKVYLQLHLYNAETCILDGCLGES
jgi:hypothetical protein